VFRPAATSILHARAVEGGLRFYPAVHFADVATTARASACAKHGRQWFCACFLGLVADPGVTYRASSRRASLRNSGSRRHSVLGRSNLRGSIFAGPACPRVQPVNTVCSGFNSAVSQGRLAAARPKYLVGPVKLRLQKCAAYFAPFVHFSCTSRVRAVSK